MQSSPNVALSCEHVEHPVHIVRPVPPVEEGKLVHEGAWRHIRLDDEAGVLHGDQQRVVEAVEDDVAHLVGDKGLLLDEGEEGVDGIVPDLSGTGSLRRLAELQRDLN